MNPDIPSLELCKRLLATQRIKGTFWCYESLDGENYSLRRSEVGWTGYEVPAPTIGEMLDYIRQCEWQVSLSLFGSKPKDEWSDERQGWIWWVHVIHAKPDELKGKRTRDVVASAKADNHANALATALAESLEKKRERP